MKTSIKSMARTVTKAAVACMLGLSALAFAGCASSNSAESATGPSFEASDIEVKQSGYTMDADGTLRYAFIAVNPNEGHLAENVVFSIQAYDADNNLVGGAGVTVPMMYPDQENAACGSTEVHASVAAAANAAASGASSTASADAESDDTEETSSSTSSSAIPQVVSIQITPVMDSIAWSDTTYDNKKLQEELSINDTHMSKSSDGSLTVGAEVSTKLESVNLQAVALLFDGDGNPICGSDAIDFECSVDDPIKASLRISDAPEYTECYMYVTPTIAL